MSNNMQKYRATLDRPFSDLFNADDFFGNRWTTRNSLPAVNISENEKEFSIELAAPGFKKEDFKVRLDDDLLTISAEQKKENKEDGKEYTRQEYSYSSFTRSFRLPEDVKSDTIEARYDNGMLRINLPKSKSQMRMGKEISIK